MDNNVTGLAESDALWLARLDRYNAGTLTPTGGGLYRWLWKRRADFQAGTLDPDLAKELTERGVDLELVPGEGGRLDRWLTHLDEFIATHGHARVPQRYRTLTGGRQLRAWIDRQCAKYGEGTLDERTARELLARGVDLAGTGKGTAQDRPASERTELTKSETRWLARLDEYIATHGDAKVPSTFCTPDGAHLGNWLARKRYHARLGKNSEPLARALAERQVRRGRPHITWDQGLSELQRFAETHGHADVPGAYITPEGLRLGKWLMNVRQNNKSGRSPLSAERQAQLRAVGIDRFISESPVTLKKNVWLSRLDQHNAGTLDAGVSQSLQDWLWKRRADFQAGTLDPDLAKELTERGVDLELVPGEDAHLDSWLAHLDEFIATYGHAKVPTKYRTPVGGRHLYRWIDYRRKKYREGTLDERTARELVARGVRLG